MQIEQLYQIYQQFPQISTDTRQISQDSLFFALKGGNFNGNTFAKQALASGARYVVIDEVAYQENDTQYILVEDVLTTLQRLAKHHRQLLNIPVIGITGTNGKTTTKELIYSVLSQKYQTLATKGNLNNHIGVPLTLLSIGKETEVAIIEMGANHVGEIDFLSSLAQPTMGLITNVGKAHLEGFGSFEGVKTAKGELYTYLADHQGTLFIQADNAHLLGMASGKQFDQVIRYGASEEYDVSGKLLMADPYLQIEWKVNRGTYHTVSTQLTGSYNTENILAAIAIGLSLGLSSDQICAGVEQYTPQNNRSQVTKTARNTVIADFYNANASSMAAALTNMEIVTASKKVIILGDMFEMGAESEAEHLTVIRQAENIPVHLRVFVGKAFYAQQNGQDHFFPTTEEAAQFLREQQLCECFILLKGSRGMAFEKLMEEL
ncbi:MULTISPECIES: UDP-N-acetylmuramoyl-tripeptide--D-alanyl-D-alanine ligase [Sphingobacterium]|uniref:UDP-N-acetylmuramoyl-tripeptide--D-alanyl-D-alanine ligase n=1 Tax=Sphingobacterium populi TaxID=1812824 RepID=A0ABW5UCM7_9SPHI|nr:UDP-N-acetylmuramoyl-tripeptide--D-alanyl-D-alanine ligase [Sphingobacterium sp. CFCC 11742]